MAVEVVVGILANSLALLSDAAHMLTDAGALVLALVAIRLAARPAGGAMTFGWKRRRDPQRPVQRRDAARARPADRLRGHPPPDRPARRRGRRRPRGRRWSASSSTCSPTWTLSKANRDSLNVEGAFQHILTDLAAFVFTAIAGLVILTTGFDQADGIASLIVAAIMLRAA